MEALLEALPHKPWKVFSGELNLVQLAAVIQHAALHLCGDTGTLHLALMTGAPAVSWFRATPGMKTWIPIGPRYRTIAGDALPQANHLAGIDTGELVQASEAVLRFEAPQAEPNFSNAHGH